MAAKSKTSADNLVWVDLEMTGLEIEKDQILEIACIVTDSELNILAEGPDIIIHQSDETLKNMNNWCIQQHGDVCIIFFFLLFLVSPYSRSIRKLISDNAE